MLLMACDINNGKKTRKALRRNFMISSNPYKY